MVRPVKRIHEEGDLRAFLASRGCEDLRGFLARVAAATRARGARGLPPLARAPEGSAGAEGALRALREMKAWVEEFPPVEQRMRYGNTAFRDWHARLQERAAALAEGVLAAAGAPAGAGRAEAADEAGAYLAEAFGDATRIDYGTGHELSFVAFLFCLERAGALGAAPGRPGGGGEAEGALAAISDVVFAEYLEVTRLVQTRYWLEPAGSHGVWGLDDYSFLPFLWGAAQLAGHKFMRPKSIFNEDVMENYARQYLYYGAVAFVRSVKRGDIRETSPMIADIARLKTWDNVLNGLMRMYDAEVLGKRPVMQHFLFGRAIPFPAAAPL